jgi:hypothetical protein
MYVVIIVSAWFYSVLNLLTTAMGCPSRFFYHNGEGHYVRGHLLTRRRNANHLFLLAFWRLCVRCQSSGSRKHESTKGTNLDPSRRQGFDHNGTKNTTYEDRA